MHLEAVTALQGVVEPAREGLGAMHVRGVPSVTCSLAPGATYRLTADAAPTSARRGDWCRAKGFRYIDLGGALSEPPRVPTLAGRPRACISLRAVLSPHQRPAPAGLPHFCCRTAAPSLSVCPTPRRWIQGRRTSRCSRPRVIHQANCPATQANFFRRPRPCRTGENGRVPLGAPTTRASTSPRGLQTLSL